jgi:hypothetical protein
MPQESKRLISPVGRIIWGSVSELNTRDITGKPEPDVEKHAYTFGLAIRKDDPGVGSLLQAFYQQAVAGYPNNQMMTNRIAQEWQSGFAGVAFRFKVKDGDRPLQRTGKPDDNARGCWVISCKTKIPIKCANAQNVEIDPKTVERGYFVDVALSIAVNEKTDNTAGLYVNPMVVRLLAFGEKIMGGISIEDAFAGHAAPTQLPPGASATPVAPAGGIPGLPGFPQSGAPQGMPQSGAPAAPMNNGPTAPNSAYPSNPQMPGFTPPPQGAGAQFPGGPAQTQAAPATGYPSNPQMPQGAGAPMPGGAGYAPAQMPGFPNGNTGSPTGYPINPATGQPYQPHPGFAAGPGQMPGS